MASNSFMFLLLALLASRAVATCPKQADIQLLFNTCAGRMDSKNCFTEQEQCGNAGKLLTEHPSCTKKLSEIFQSSDCATIYADFQAPYISDDTALIIGNETCSLGLLQWINRECSQAECPGTSDLNDLLPLASCLVGATSGLSEKELADYRPYECLQENEKAGRGKPQICPALEATYGRCSDQTYEVVNLLAGTDATDETTCLAVLKGDILGSYCTQTFGLAVADFCNPSFCELRIGGISQCIVIFGGTFGGIALLIASACYMRYSAMNKAKREAGLVGNSRIKSQGSGGLSPIGYNQQQQHQSMQLNPQFSPQQSQGGYVPPPPGQGMQRQASTGSMTGSGPSNSGGSAPRMDIAFMEQRRQELINFYKINDPQREDVNLHVEKLLTKYSFENLVKALRAKYGILPPGWDDILREMKGTNVDGPTDAYSALPGGSSKPAATPKDVLASIGHTGKAKAKNQKKFKKYNEMATLGLPEETIREAMKNDGVKNPEQWVYRPHA